METSLKETQGPGGGQGEGMCDVPKRKAYLTGKKPTDVHSREGRLKGLPGFGTWRKSIASHDPNMKEPLPLLSHSSPSSLECGEVPSASSGIAFHFKRRVKV